MSSLLERAKRSLVGGTNSPVRSFRAVGIDPIFLSKAEGPFVYDLDGRRYIDLICGWGSVILGHATEEVVEAAIRRIRDGHILGLTCDLEVELAEEVKRSFRSVEFVRFTNSGTEALMTAVRLARAWTGRKKTVVFEGCYHGHSDQLLTKEARDPETLVGVPSSQGIPAEVVSNTIVVPFNDIETVRRALRSYKDEIAAILLEPVPANMGVVKPVDGFLEELREVADREECLLIFDEVVTGFRIAKGGAQELYRVEPDLTCLGKILGGGLPIGCVGGRGEIMRLLAPEGPVYHAGTFAGNPLVMAVGLETLRNLTGRAYEVLEEVGKSVSSTLLKLAEEFGENPVLNRVGSMFTIFFTNGKDVRNYRDAKSSDPEAFRNFFIALLKSGVLMPPSQFEASFVTISHSKVVRELERTFGG